MEIKINKNACQFMSLLCIHYTNRTVVFGKAFITYQKRRRKHVVIVNGYHVIHTKGYIVMLPFMRIGTIVNTS